MNRKKTPLSIVPHEFSPFDYPMNSLNRVLFEFIEDGLQLFDYGDGSIAARTLQAEYHAFLTRWISLKQPIIPSGDKHGLDTVNSIVRRVLMAAHKTEQDYVVFEYVELSDLIDNWLRTKPRAYF